MGNYNGNVRCGVCYQRGHNKRTCPRETKNLESQLEAYQHRAQQRVANGNDDGYYDHWIASLAQKIAKRTGTHPLTGKAIPKGQRGPKRRCSYCKHIEWRDEDLGTGHTRRTCETLKSDIRKAHKINRAYREGALKLLRDKQIGLGALIKIKASGYYKGEWTRKPAAFMVQSIRWDSINYVSVNETVLLMKRTDTFGNHREGNEGLTLPTTYYNPVNAPDHVRQVRFDPNTGEWGTEGYKVGNWTPEAETCDYGQHPVLSPTPADSINPPSGWLDSASPAIEEHFKTLKG